jgi:hypothetical protein
MFGGSHFCRALGVVVSPDDMEWDAEIVANVLQHRLFGW